MSLHIELGMLCRYVGPGNGRMLKHKVIEATPKHVITWSQYQVGDVLTEGYSWMGPRQTFVEHFRPLMQGEV